ncbi:hypothetical protein GE21DRAFT_1218700 [Neurospora crassa]|nr:hypothetical protein GE21DRAFT_1218700 [Neurospora crassa]
MDLHPTLRGILAMTLASFALVAHALPQPQPQAQETVAPSPKVWVHVDATTKGVTITPTVTTYRDGDKSTQSAPPPYLTVSKAYSSFKDDGVLATFTSLNPAPTALGISGVTDPRGEFLACLPQQSLDEPFCAPKRDVILRPGHGYYITWNTLYFALPNQRVQILLQTANVPDSLSQDSSSSSSSSSPKPVTPTLPHFSILPADQGFALLPLPRSFLGSSSSHQIIRLNITMAVWASGNYDEDAPTETKQGPLVYITNGYQSDDVDDGDGNHDGDDSDDDDDNNDDGLVGDPGGLSKGKKIAISVPVAIVFLLVLGGLIAFAVWGYRKKGAVPWVGGLFGTRRGGPGGRGGGSGYGVRKSYSERVGGKRGAGAGVSGFEEGMIATRGAGDNKGGGGGGGGGGVELTDRDSWSPTSPTSARLGGVNVFRAEIERQERARQG